MPKKIGSASDLVLPFASALSPVWRWGPRTTDSGYCSAGRPAARSASPSFSLRKQRSGLGLAPGTGSGQLNNMIALEAYLC